MKHIKLFEAFNEDPAMQGQIVIGVISEGVDVAVFPAREANMVWQNISSLQSDYYLPFRFDLGESLESLKSKTGGAIYLVIDSMSEITNSEDSQLGFPPVNVPGMEDCNVLIYTARDLSLLLPTLPMPIYNQDGEVSGEDSNNLYAVELVDGNQFMEAQSWGVELKTGAMEHFMEIVDDEEEGPEA
jgi:hypothetical protein